MSDITAKRICSGISTAGVASYLKVFSLVTSLLTVWVGLCAI
jgi:hypothetical protein